MTAVVTHTTVATLPDQAGVEINKAEWNADHAITGVASPAQGGTDSAYFKVAGPTVERIYTFPDAAATILTTNAAVTVAQGGTGLASGTSGGVLYFSAAGTLASSGVLTAGRVVLGGGAGAAPNDSASLTFDGTKLTATGGFATGSTSATFKAIGRAAALDQIELLKGDASGRSIVWLERIFFNAAAGSYLSSVYVADAGSSVGRVTLPANTGSTFGWSNTSNDAAQAIDTAFTRLAAGSVALGTGAAGSFAGSLKAAVYQGMMGTGTGIGNMVSTANVTTTAVATTGAGPDNLISYTLPASSFSAAGKGVHITVWGTSANTAETKTVILYFGSTAILTNALTASIAGVWRIEADVYSTGTDTQDYVAQLVTTGTAGVALNDIEVGTSTQDDGATIVIKTTGTVGAPSTAAGIVAEGMTVRFIN